MEMEMVDLADVLEEETKFRPEEEPKEELQEAAEPGDDFSNLEFEDVPEEEEVETVQAKPQITDKAAKESAEMVIDLIEMFNTTTLSPLARWRLRKKIGGKEVFKQLLKVYEKEMRGEDLTDKEKRQLEAYYSYEQNKKEVDSIVAFTPEERKKLETAMTAYFKKKNVQFSGDYAFWLELAMIEGMKVFGILTI